MTTAPAAAHPLGNFTTNTAAAIVVTPDAVEVAYVVDLAEIPALRVVQELDADGSGAVEGGEGGGAPGPRVRRAGRGALPRGGRPGRRPGGGGDRPRVPTGEAGLPTLRLTCDLRAPAAGRTVELRDGNLDGRVGWREVTATGRGVALEDRDVPAVSSTGGLRRYPRRGSRHPWTCARARLVVGPGTGGSGPGVGWARRATRGSRGRWRVSPRASPAWSPSAT